MDERIHNRAVTDAAVACHTAQGLRWTTLWNLSTSGCLLEGLDEHQVPGTSIAIELLENICISGQVVWRQDQYAGIAFSSEVSDLIIEQLDVTRNAGLWMRRLDIKHPLQDWSFDPR